MLAVVTTLAAVCIAWAATPLQPGVFPRIALICAGVAGAAGTAELAVAGARPALGPVVSAVDRLVVSVLSGIESIPWAEVMTVAVLVLEAQHPPWPWHTGLLGVALLGYLFAVHLAETRARAGVLRPQLPLLAAGIALMALAVGAAAVPGLPEGVASTVVRFVAIAAAVLAAVLAVPVWLNRQGGS